MAFSAEIRKAMRSFGKPLYNFIATNKYKHTRSVKIYADGPCAVGEVPVLTPKEKKILEAVKALADSRNVPLTVKRSARSGFGYGMPAIIFSYPFEF